MDNRYLVNFMYFLWITKLNDNKYVNESKGEKEKRKLKKKVEEEGKEEEEKGQVIGLR